MCGIIGIVSKYQNKHIEACNSMINHRGPDSHGLYTHGNISLGHQRLSILDLSENGDQPIHTSDGRYTMIFNGEIYNHKEIRKSLKDKYEFKSHADTETILYAFVENGPTIFKELNGIFALAILDHETHRLVLARDHFGVKPLYIYQNESEFYFGSELKSFLKIPNWDKSLDYRAIANYKHFLWSPGSQTPFLKVKKFPPGHFMCLDIRTMKTSAVQYYEIPFDGIRETRSEEEWINELDKYFSNAVERQLLSDVPIGFFLSGGLDSSLVVAKAKEFSDKRIQCFTIDTETDKNGKDGFANDLYYSQKVAKHLDVDLHIVKANVDIVQDFDKMIWHLDEPQADPASLNIYNICSLGKEMGFKVLIGGAAGDDLFSGYRRHQALNYEKYFDKIPNGILKLVNALLGPFSSHNPIIRRAKKLLKDIDKTKIHRMAGYYEWFPYSKQLELYSQALRDELINYDPAQILIDRLAHIPNEKSALNHLLYWDMKYFLPDHNLNYTDKLSMAKSIEVRVPFLDLDLVNMSTKIPINLKMNGNTTKYLLKKVGEKYLPHDVIYRPKTGFGAPVRKWITEDLDDMINERLSPAKLKSRGIYDSKKVWNLIKDNKDGKIDGSYTIWSLLAIESWMEQFVDNV